MFPLINGHSHTRGNAKKWNLFIKNCVFILTCLSFSHLQSTIDSMQYTYRDFFPLLKTVFELIDLVSFTASAIFCFNSSPLAKCFPLRTFLTLGNKKKSHLGRDWVNRKVGHRGHAVFGQKLLNTQSGMGRCTRKSPIMKWANVLKAPSKKKKSVKPNTACHNKASWYTDADGLLEYSTRGGSQYYNGPALQKIIPFWGVPPCILLLDILSGSCL